MDVYSEVEISGEEINSSFKTYRAALEMMTGENVILMQQIFEGGCKKVQCLVLKVAFEAEMLQNRVLKKHLQPAKNIVNEDDLKEQALQQPLQDCASKLAAALERCAQLNAGKDRIEEENGTLQERCTEPRRESDHIKAAREEEFEQLTSKWNLEEFLLKHCALLKAKVARIHWENRELRDSIIELRDRLTNQEMLQEQCREYEEEIEKLTVQNGKLQQVFKCVSSKLSPDVEQRYLQLKTEYDIRHENVQRLRDDVYSMFKKLAQEWCWRGKSEAMELSRGDLKREQEVFKKHLKMATEVFEHIKKRDRKFKNWVEKIEVLKTATDKKQEEVDKMQKEVLNLKAMSESYKHIDDDEADIQALNKTLEKKKVKLEKELQTLKQIEVEFQKVTSDSRKLIETTCSLYKQVVTLKDQIAQQVQLKVHLKRQKSEKEGLVQRQKDLKKKISRLERALFDAYVAKLEKLDDEITQLQRSTDELQSQYEELLVAEFTQAMWEQGSDHRMKAIQEMKQVNDNMEFIISEQRKKLKVYL